MRRIGKWLLIGFGGLIALGVIANIASPGGGTANASQTASPNQASASPDETSSPTAAGTPTPVPTPTPAPTPAFADIALAGTGDAVPRFEIPEDSVAIAQLTHTGSANFAVFTIGADGAQGDLLVNAIGSYSGTVLFDEQDGQHSVAFEVTADGPWTITIRPVAAARAWDGASDLTGSGDDVVRISPPVAGFLTADVTHAGEGNFAVISYGSGVFGQDLLVNEIGNYSGEVLISEGSFLLQITADGAWTISPS